MHDLWGRVLPGAPHEITATLHQMVKRGCAPRELILRLRGGSTTAREARGLAVLNAFAPCSATSFEQRIHCSGGGGCRAGSGGACGNGSSGAALLRRSSNSSSSSAAVCSADSSSCCSSDCSSGESGGGSRVGSCRRSALADLRLEGVPLTSRVLRALAAAGQGLKRVKLYGYNLSEDGDFREAASDTPRLADLSSRPPCGNAGIKQAGEKHSTLARPSSNQAATQCPGPTQQRTEAHQGVGALAQGWGLPPLRPAPGSAGARGLPALLRLLGPQLQELTLQDCSIRSRARLDGDGVDNADVRRGGGGGANVHGDVSGDAGTAYGSAAERVRTADQTPDEAAATGPRHCRRSASLTAAEASLLAAIRRCSGLRHLGLRHSAADGCPVLQLLLRPGVCVCTCDLERLGGGGDCAGMAASSDGPKPLAPCTQAAAPARHRDRSSLSTPRGGLGGGAERGALGGGGGCGGGGGGAAIATSPASANTKASAGSSASHPRSPPSVLATLTQLVSFKVQTALPLPGGRPALAAALQLLTGLTRLELGERSAVQSVAALMLQPPRPPALLPTALALRNLRDVSFVSAQVTSPAELAALAELRELTRLSLGALNLASDRSALDAGGLNGGAATPGTLPLPLRLQELSVAATLSPTTLLRLRRPPTLRTLRLTGFSLCADDVDDRATGGTSGGSGDVGDAGGGGNAPLAMRPSAECQLSEAVALLQGRFAYRDLGIELHIGFHGSAAGPRRYLAAPGGLERPVGHWAWASRLQPLALQGLELAGLELREDDVAALARQLLSLEDLRLDCRYPLAAVRHLSALRRLRRLLLNASFWRSGPKASPQQPAEEQWQHQEERQQEGQAPLRQAPHAAQQPGCSRGQSRPLSDAEAAAGALTSLCSAAPDCLYDVALASYGRASARFCAMQALVWVEAELPRVGGGALRLWVCP